MSHIPRDPRPGQEPPAAHLKLVHPAAPKTPRPRGRHRRGDPFTVDEQARLKAALRNARTLFGSWDCLTDALGVGVGSGEMAMRTRVSPDLAVRLARALGKPLESLYRAPADAQLCPTCGRRGAP